MWATSCAASNTKTLNTNWVSWNNFVRTEHLQKDGEYVVHIKTAEMYTIITQRYIIMYIIMIQTKMFICQLWWSNFNYKIVQMYICIQRNIPLTNTTWCSYYKKVLAGLSFKSTCFILHCRKYKDIVDRIRIVY